MKTLLTAETTKQQLFDHVVLHLREQGQRSVAGIDCVYRSPNGLMCAIGACISDDSYSKDMEGIGVGILIDNYFPFAQHLKPLAIDLQNTHDLVIHWDDSGFIAEDTIAILAVGYDVTVPALK